MRLLDLFCGAGGAAAGYAAAGFEVVGVDIDPQPSYPFEFIQADALEFLGSGGADCGFAAVHASPPCQAYSVASKAWNGRADQHPDLVAPTRRLLRAIGLPYVIENVEQAPLERPVRLCGSSFGLDVRRHRGFESNWPLVAPPCNHRLQTPRFPALRSGRSTLAAVVGVFGTGGGDAKDIDVWKRAMRIDWMQTKHELAESIPPVYTEFVGRQLWLHLRAQRGLAA